MQFPMTKQPHGEEKKDARSRKKKIQHDDDDKYVCLK